MTYYLQDISLGQPAFLWGQPTVVAAYSETYKTGFTADHVIEPEELTGWSPNGTTYETLTLDFGTPTMANALAMVGVNLGGDLALHGSDNGTSWTAIDSWTGIPAGSEVYYQQFTQSTFRYFRLSFTGITSTMVVNHLAIGPIALLPWFDDGVCIDPIEATATDLISPSGLFLGTVQQRAMRSFNVPWSQITELELVAFRDWATNCVARRQPFFFIPDTYEAAVYFAWTSSGYKFNPVRKNGLINIGSVQLMARVTS